VPWLPRFVWRWLVEEEEYDDGEPMFCAEMVVRVLQAAGMLPNQPGHLTTASDLWVLARLHLKAFEDRPHNHKQVVFADACGYPICDEVAYNLV